MISNQREHEHAQNDNLVVIDAMFQHDALVLQVCRVSNVAVRTRVVAPRARRGKFIEFQDTAYVAQRIAEYNSLEN